MKLRVKTERNFLERIFKLSENGTNVKTEILAGMTTFLTCVYIVAVNPAILSTTGMDPKAIFWATALSSAIASIGMGLWTNFPFALCPAMGLNAYFAYYVVGTLGLSWQNALMCVFISGVIFVLLGLLKVQKTIVNGIPHAIKHAIGAGIGFFIAFIGFTQAGIVQGSSATLVQLGDLSNPGAILALLGLALIAVLVIKRVKGAMLIGMLAITVIGFFVKNPTTGLAYSTWPVGGILAFDSPFTALAPTFGQLSAKGMFATSISSAVFVILGFLFVDLFDSVGVLLGVSAKAGFIDKDGKLPKAGKALMVSAGGAAIGAVLGTNTVTVYGAESTTGISEGGRTGLVAVVVGILFIFALFLSPLFLAVPTIATAPALIMVGVYMMEPLKSLHLEDLTVALPVFLAIVTMPFTFSIAHGVLFSVLGYTLAMCAASRKKEITKTVWVLTLIFFVYLIIEAIQ